MKDCTLTLEEFFAVADLQLYAELKAKRAKLERSLRRYSNKMYDAEDAMSVFQDGDPCFAPDDERFYKWQAKYIDAREKASAKKRELERVEGMMSRLLRSKS